MKKFSLNNLKEMPLFFLLLVSCITQPGIEPQNSAGRGNVVVTEKNGISAQVFLDYRKTNYTTPAVIQDVSSGKHTLHIFYPNRRSIPELINVHVKENANNEAQFELQKSECGTITVQTIPDSARIMLNNVDYGRSPLSITGLPVGSYSVYGLLGNYHSVNSVVNVSSTGNTTSNLNLVLNRFVILEYFSNTNCAGCPAAGTAIENLLEQLPQYKDMIFQVSYHADFPSPNDPFFLTAKSDQSTRVEWYGVDTDPGGLPLIYVNGVKLVYSNEQTFIVDAKQKIETIFIKKPVAELLFKDIKLNSLQATGTIAVKNSISGLQLFVALVEDFVGYPIPPGTNNKRLFHTIFRGFSPEANGLDVGGSDAAVSFSFAVSNYAQSNLSAVAFLQDKITKEIVQSQRIFFQ